MPDIVLKNILGQEVVYPGIDTVKLKNTAGDDETFSHGVAITDVPIELDLANGETQTIYAPEGALVKSAVVTVTGGGNSEPVLNMPETVLSFELGELMGIPVTVATTPVDINYIIEGATYDVIWNGTPVTCVAWKGEYGGAEIMGIGNIGVLMNAPTTEPFIIGTVNGEMVIIAIESITTATVSVTLKFKDDTLFPANIKKGVTINGVTGSYYEPVLTTESLTATFLSASYEQTGASCGSCLMDIGLTEVVEGKTYKIKWNSSEYTCIGFYTGLLKNELGCLGNASIAGLGTDTGEPFFIFVQSDKETMYSTIFCKNELAWAEHTFQVSIASSGGGESGTPTYLTKKITKPALTATGTVTLVTKEELDAIGFSTSKKCFLSIQPMAQVYPSSGYTTIVSMYLANFNIINSGYGSSASPRYGQVLYSKGSTSGYYVNSAPTSAVITANYFSSSNTYYPYYDVSSGAIVFNAGGNYKLNGNNGTCDYILTVGYHE